MLPSKKMNKKLEITLCCRRRKTDLPADISVKINIAQFSTVPEQRSPSPVPILPRHQLTPPLYPRPQPNYLSPPIQRNPNGREERKTEQQKWKFKLLFIDRRNYAGKRQMEVENQDRQHSKKRI